MREVSFILPFHVAGNYTFHSEFRQRLAKYFGGYTVAPNYGGWVDDKGQLIEEENYEYRVAVENDAKEEQLFSFAVSAANRAKQQALYWKGANGTASIVNVADALQMDAA